MNNVSLQSYLHALHRSTTTTWLKNNEGIWLKDKTDDTASKEIILGKNWNESLWSGVRRKKNILSWWLIAFYLFVAIRLSGQLGSTCFVFFQK